MLSNHRLVAFIPSGRQRVQSTLIDNLRRFPELDEVQIWMNTDDSQVQDREWLYSLPSQWNKVRILELQGSRDCSCWEALNGSHTRGGPGHLHRPKQLNTGTFYVHTVDSDAIYFRFDDDIVYVDDSYFTNMVEFRLAHPEYFLVMGNIWNNATTSFIQQQLGRLDHRAGTVQSPYCMDMVAWQSGPFAEYIHRVMLEHIRSGITPNLWFEHRALEGARFSISNFAFMGSAFAEFGGMIPMLDEEIWLTEIAGRPNAICGNALTAHYSFFAQRDFLDTTDVLQQYAAIARDKLSASYYTLLAAS